MVRDMKELISVDRKGPSIGVITFQRPEKKNALSIALRDAVSSALDALRSDPDLKVVILTGAGDVFSAGFDLGEFALAKDDPGLREKIWLSSDRYHQTLLNFPLPLIAAVNGPALAGGCDTATLCDLRVASTQARFGHPEATWATVVYGPLHDLLGGALARDLCLTGRTLDATEALRLNFVTAVVRPDVLLEEAFRLAEQIARAPREILLRTKAKIVRTSAIAFTGTLDL
jgi:enoyl-CoA hydratase/carnithine racemase